jgi:hypothetical protein
MMVRDRLERRAHRLEAHGATTGDPLARDRYPPSRNNRS